MRLCEAIGTPIIASPVTKASAFSFVGLLYHKSGALFASASFLILIPLRLCSMTIFGCDATPNGSNEEADEQVEVSLPSSSLMS